MDFEEQYFFSTTSHTSGLGVHTFDIINASGLAPSYEYLGYAGPVQEGAIDLWGSDTLTEWTKLDQSPVLERSGIRWATAIVQDGEVWLVARNTYSKFHRGLNRLLTLNHNMPSSVIAPTGKMRLDLYHSEDGIDFEFVETVVSASDTGAKYNRNPFLWQNPETGNLGLVYYTENTGDGLEHLIHYREAAHPTQLEAATDTLLVEEADLVAAPTLSYDDSAGQYCLWVEGVSDTGKWTTELYRTASLSEKITTDRHVIFDTNTACPFPHQTGNTDLLFVSHCTEPVQPGTVDAPWQGKLFAYQ
ncbi:hypothetical protein ACOJIV_06630 [Haloarcula sp. AONF1]